jgi:transcriptional regulator with XRE-family HTH domain
MTVGRTIKFLRVAAGLKQKSLADRLDVTPNYLSLVENDKREPSIAFLKSLADEMGIPLGLMFLEIEKDITELTPEERAILIRIEELVFQLQKIRLQSEDDGAHGS